MKKFILALAAALTVANPAAAQSPNWIPGDYTLAPGPLNLEDNFTAAGNCQMVAWVVDRPGGAGFMVSNCVEWVSDQGPKGDKGDKGDTGDDGRDGANGLDGSDGTDGVNGKSAYEVAQDNGFAATEAQWLASLKGDKGADGATGPQGPKGDKGDDGLSAVVASNVSRTLDSTFTISATRPALVSYTVKSTVTTTLLIASASATAFLEYSTDSGATWITASDTGASLDGVSVAIGQVIRGRYVLAGTIPAGASVRIRSEVTGSGTGTLEYVRGQEVLI